MLLRGSRGNVRDKMEPEVKGKHQAVKENNTVNNELESCGSI